MTPPSDQSKPCSIHSHDPSPLCPVGICLELLKMQHEIDDKLASVGVEPMLDDKTKLDETQWRFIVLMFRFYGLRSLRAKGIRVLLAEWLTHKASGQPDTKFLGYINSTIGMWNASEERQPKN